MLVNAKDLLEKAKKGGYAVGAFNTINLETTQAIIEAAHELSSPVIVQMTEKTFDYAGGRAIFQITKNIAELYNKEVPVAIHLDHGKNFEVVERAMEIGFGSVMYDGSRKDYVDNLKMTKKIVALAHEKGISVQAELGNVPYIGEMQMETVEWERYMTNPDQAVQFVTETGIDTLAVAIGNAHGFFRERSVPDYDRLSTIASLIDIPLVLHGASDWQSDRVTEVIRRGISCFNVDTATRVAFIGALHEVLQSPDEADLRKVLGRGREAVKETVKAKILAFGSAGKIA